VLEGGGDRGAYQAGAIRGLIENLPPKDVEYDVLSGVSIGAINAAGFSFFKKGQEDEASQYLLDMWGQLSADLVYANWPGWVIEGAFMHNGLYNNTRFVDFLMDFVKFDKMERKIVVGTTDAKNGSFVRFDENTPFEELLFKAVAASSAFPAFFQSVEYLNNTYIDGGVLINLDIAGAIEKCKEIGARESDITIDIVMTDGSCLIDANVSDYNAIQMFRRYLQIANYQKTMVWITQGKANFPNVNFRYIVSPVKSISTEWIPIGFKQKEIQRLIGLGKEDAKRTIEEGEGVMFHQLTSSWSQAMNPGSMFHPTEDLLKPTDNVSA
jgi:hypothetical protein